MSIPLPDRPGWKLVRPGRSRFLVLRHAATASQLVLRDWREDERMNRARCEKRARIWRDFVERERLVSERFIDLPKGYDTRVDVGFSLPAGAADQSPIGGYVLAFGARGRRCFAFIYSTSASGPGAETRISERLAVLQTRVLEHIRWPRDLSR
jgi:hypothetical protein